MYAKNQKVTARFPYSEETKALSSTGQAASRTGSIRHPAEEPSGVNDNGIAREFIYFVRAVSRSFFVPEIAGKSRRLRATRWNALKASEKYTNGTLRVHILESIR